VVVLREQVYVVGGPAAVSDNVLAEIRAMGLTVNRIAGPNRQATAIALFEFAAQKFNWKATHVNLARGDNWPDARSRRPARRRGEGTRPACRRTRRPQRHDPRLPPQAQRHDRVHRRAR
jgi:hypothetical protein